MNDHSEPGLRPEPDPPQGERKRWVPPEISDLPRLTDLTLLTGDPIFGGGDTGGSGSTVF